MRPTVAARSRRSALLLIVAVAVFSFAPTAAHASAHASAEVDFAGRINAERAAAGLGPLAVNVHLTAIARGWSGVMAAEDRMYHNPDLARQVQWDWQRLGENVGYTSRGGATQAELVDRLHRAFMDSPPHRANVLGNFNQIGVGVVMATPTKLWVTVNFMQSTTLPEREQLEEAIRVSREIFAAAGSTGHAASYVVLARGEVFADALGGAGLAGTSAPILFTNGPVPAEPNPPLHPATRVEIDRVLGGSGKVYVLGGPAAISDRAASELAADGYQIVRLSGATRIETSVAVAREIRNVRGDVGEVLIARADDWPDAVTGGAYAAFAGAPLVLTDRGSLHPAVAQFLAEARPARRWALGGQAALSDAVVAQAGAERIAGVDRTATAVAVAERLWGRTTARSGDLYVSTPSAGEHAWAFALAYAPWSAVNGSPQLLVGDGVPESVRSYLGALGYRSGVSGDVKAASVVPALVVGDLKALVSG